MSIIREKVSKCYTIELGDTIEHPVFGPMKVNTIFKLSEDEYQIAVDLQNFNNTLRFYEGMELLRIKYKRRTMLRIVR
jgi:hypothetical protein